ncbi:hypothetical protein [Arthrobacter sp. AFG20]|uniref:hypothetical protein n=1 Tax=Arthrobacter sp. AFG20 TaxID=1688671 RepID=UPI0011AF907F|nr:hypothetical protein [Arthrobacter sp. AFG20]
MITAQTVRRDPAQTRRRRRAGGDGTRTDTAPKSVELGLRGMAPIRPGSAISTTPTPAQTRLHTGPDSGPVIDR